MPEELNYEEERKLREEAHRYQRQGPEPRAREELSGLNERIRELETMLRAAHGEEGVSVNLPSISVDVPPGTSTSSDASQIVQFWKDGILVLKFMKAAGGSTNLA